MRQVADFYSDDRDEIVLKSFSAHFADFSAVYSIFIFPRSVYDSMNYFRKLEMRGKAQRVARPAHTRLQN